MKMINKFLITGVLLFLSLAVFSKKSEITLGKIRLMNELIEIKIPTHFSALLDHEVKQNYPAEKLPKVVYGDSLREVRLAFYSKKSEVAEAGTGALKASVLSDFLRDDLKLKELSNGITVVDNREMGYLGILHKSPEKFYRFYFLTVYKGLVLSGELISPKKGYKTWIPIGEEIMNSLDIKAD